jgi:hypothetical protein
VVARRLLRHIVVMEAAHGVVQAVVVADRIGFLQVPADPQVLVFAYIEFGFLTDEKGRTECDGLGKFGLRPVEKKFLNPWRRATDRLGPCAEMTVDL